MKVLCLFIAIAVVVTAAHAKAVPPWPAELDAAAIVQDRLDDGGKRALPLGNGDLNGLLWDRDGALCIRVTKNDLWDARIDTSQDPPLLWMYATARGPEEPARCPAGISFPIRSRGVLL